MATTAPAKNPFRPFRMTVAAYLRMIGAGILTENDRVFLWKGRLFEKMTKGRPHTVAVVRLHEALRRAVPSPGHYIEQEQPVALRRRNDSMPEPDLQVVRGRPEDYRDTPTTGDVALIVEVADSSLPFDMGPKQRVYAAESVPEYWVVSVSGRWVEVFTRPSGPKAPRGYQSRTTYRAGDRIPVTIDGAMAGHVAVDEIFP